MEWYGILFASVLELVSMFLIWGKLNRKVSLTDKKSICIILVIAVLTLVFNVYKINIGFLINYIVICTMAILLFKLPIKETIIQFSITIIIIATIQPVFVYTLLFFKGTNIVSSNELIIANLIIFMLSVLIYRFVEFNKIRQYILEYKNIIIIGTINVTGVILVSMYMYRIYENFLQEYILYILAVIVVWETLNVYFLYQSVRIRQQQKIIDIHERYTPFLKNMMHEMKQKQHDFKNHLNVIYIIVQAENDGQVRDKIKGYIEKLVDSIKPTDELLNIKDQILGAIIYSKKVLAQKKNICFKVEFKGEVPEYPIEKYELVELLGNLLDNAIEAAEDSDDNPEVILTLGIENGFKMIEIRNTGKTIQQSDMDKVFRRGFSTKSGKDRGYGLYNVRRIVNYYGGIIRLFFDNGYTVFKILFERQTEQDKKTDKNLAYVVN